MTHFVWSFEFDAEQVAQCGWLMGKYWKVKEFRFWVLISFVFVNVILGCIVSGVLSSGLVCFIGRNYLYLGQEERLK